MAKRKPKIGDVVRIVFIDHTEGGCDKVYEFEVFGRLAVDSDLHYTVDSWSYLEWPEGHSREQERENISSFNIVKAAIKSIEVLTARKD
jgi:hypothetical protein